MGNEVPSTLVVTPFDGTIVSANKESVSNSTSSVTTSSFNTIAHNSTTTATTTTTTTSSNTNSNASLNSTTIHQSPISLGEKFNNIAKKKLGRKKQPGMPGTYLIPNTIAY